MRDILEREAAAALDTGYAVRGKAGAHVGPVHADLAFATTRADFAALKHDWTALERESGPALNFFQTYAWLWSWFETHEAQLQADNTELLIVTTRAGGRLTSVWPLMIVREAGLRVVRWMSEPHLQYGDALATSDAERMGHFRQVWDELMSLRTWDTMVLSKSLKGSRLHGFLEAQNILTCNDGVASMLDLTPYRTPQDYYSALSRSRRKRTKRRRNKLAGVGELNFSVHTDGPEFAAAVQTALELKQQWLVENALQSQTIFGAETQDFLGELGNCTPAGAHHIAAVMTVGGKPAAIEIGFLRGDHYYAYLGAFDGSLRDYSPGKVQMAMMVEWCIEQGAEKYDLLGTPALYKSEWTDTAVEMRDYCYGRTLWGYVYTRVWLGLLRPTAKAMLENLSVEHRRRVLALLGAGPRVDRPRESGEPIAG